MAAPGAALRFKRLRQRFVGISAPKMAIRTHVAWYWRALAMVAVVSVSLLLAAWVYDTGLRMAGFRSDETGKEIQSLRNHVMELDSELTKLRALAGAGESRLQIEQAALRQLSMQVRTLEAENASLKEDLALFEGLMSGPASIGDGAVRIDHLRIGEVVEGGGSTAIACSWSITAADKAKSSRERLPWLSKVGQQGKMLLSTSPPSARGQHNAAVSSSSIFSGSTGRFRCRQELRSIRSRRVCFKMA